MWLAPQASRLIALTLWPVSCYVLFVFAGLEAIFRLMDTLNHQHAEYSALEVVLVTLSALPLKLYEHLPLIVLIGTATSLGILAKNSELTILRAAGLSRNFIIGLVSLQFIPVFVVALVVGEYGVPDAQRYHQALLNESSATASERIWTRENNSFVAIDLALGGQPSQRIEYGYDRSAHSIRALTRSVIKPSDSLFTWLSVARTEFSDSEIKLVDSSTAGVAVEHVSTDLLLMSQHPTLLRTSELWRVVDYLEQEGLNARQYEQALWARILLPGTLVVLICFAALTAFGSFRHVDLATRVFTAVVAGLIYRYLTELSAPLTFIFGLHPVFAVALPLLIPLVFMPLLARLR